MQSRRLLVVEGTKSGEAPSSAISHHERPWFRVYHGHRVSTITPARREYRFGKHSGAATRGIRHWKKSSAHDEIWISLAILCHKTHSVPRAFLEFPTSDRHANFSSVLHTLPLLLHFFRNSRWFVQKKKKEENVFTRNVCQRMNRGILISGKRSNLFVNYEWSCDCFLSRFLISSIFIFILRHSFYSESIVR